MDMQTATSLKGLDAKAELEFLQLQQLQIQIARQRRARLEAEKPIEQQANDPVVLTHQKAFVEAFPLRQFVEETFPVVQKGRKFDHYWHIDIICELLQAAVIGEVKNFIINQPRRTMKSILTCVMFPAWVWTFLPHLRFLYTSYSAGFAGRDNKAFYELTQSEYYQSRWGNQFAYTTKKVSKELRNTKGGFRIVFKIGGGTGEGGDFVIADDPNSIEQVESDKILETTNNNWNEISYHNVTNRNTAVRGIVQQRTTYNDLTGNITEDAHLKLLYKVLCLAMRYEDDNPLANTPHNPLKLGFISAAEKSSNSNLKVGEQKLWVDPRDLKAQDFENTWYQEWYKRHFKARNLISKGKGQSLVEGYVDEKTIREEIAHLKAYGESSQYQQRPIPRGGAFFNSANFKEVHIESIDLSQLVFCRAFDKGGCFVEGTLVETINGAVPIEDIKVGDLVLTRNGYKKVQWSGITKFIDEVTTVVFSDGRRLNGTPDHPVWTENRGWVELQNLRSYDNISTLNNYTGVNLWEKTTEANACPILKSKFLTELSIPADQIEDITKQGLTTRLQKKHQQNHFTGQYGQPLMAQSLLGITSIIKTKIGTTMTSPILNVLPEVGITGNTERFGKHLKCLLTSNGFNQKVLKPRTNGTRQPFIEHIIASEQIAGQHFKVNALTSLCRNIVPQNAKIKQNDCGENFVRVEKVSGKCPVYDLTVEGEHEFYANGILVHNTEGGGDDSVGLLMARTITRPFTFYIFDVWKDKVGLHNRMNKMLELANQDTLDYISPYEDNEYTVFIEKEGASSGIDVSTLERDALVGYDVQVYNPRKNKAQRAKPAKSASEGGKIKLVKQGLWKGDFIRELEKFDPNKLRNKDNQVDTFAMAFNFLCFMHISSSSKPSSGVI